MDFEGKGTVLNNGSLGLAWGEGSVAGLIAEGTGPLAEAGFGVLSSGTRTQGCRSDHFVFEGQEATVVLQPAKGTLRVGAGPWLAQDPLGFEAGDYNLFRYVGNNATNAMDPSGLAAPPPRPLTSAEQFPPLRADYLKTPWPWKNNEDTIDFLMDGPVTRDELRSGWSARYEGFVTATITKKYIWYSPDRRATTPSVQVPYYRITVTDDTWDRPDFRHDGRINSMKNKHFEDMKAGKARWIYFPPKGIKIKESFGTATHKGRYGTIVNTPTMTWTWDVYPEDCSLISHGIIRPGRVEIAIAGGKPEEWYKENLVVEWRVVKGQPQLRLAEVWNMKRDIPTGSTVYPK
jgi:RHS repeat-associated protein